jgi:A/G-specific adenine glycosylase
METPPSLLLAWYDRQRRDLPWRRGADAWAIWVSEVMLQQTRVDSVVPYYERFLARFPTPSALAEADETEALALWSGLGYYRRVRLLRAGAARVVAAGGELPRTAAELEQLPGIGTYTAAAVASIAFGECVPVLDGNVERVMARRLALTQTGGAAARRTLLAAAAKLLDAGRPGDSNQALMELGATLCTPRAPRCEACPLRAGCAAAAAGDPESYPALRRRVATRREHQTAVLVEDARRRILLSRRPVGERVLPGLWELPTVVARGPKRAGAALAARYGGEWRLEAPVAALRHAITFRILEIELRRGRWWPDGVGEATELDWRSPATAGELALTGATRKLLARLAPPAAGG